MNILRHGLNLAAVRNAIRAADRRLLMLDYDGCLAPFHVERDRALPYDGVLPLLARIREDPRNTVAVVTGRDIHDIVPLLGAASVTEIWGCHGWERLCADGRMEPANIPPEAAAALALAKEILETAGWGGHIERKTASLAVHWRGLPAQEQQALVNDIGALLLGPGQGRGLEPRRFDGGIEFRVEGQDKGSVVRTLLAEHPDAVLPTYLGDDLTDEDAFCALWDHGLRVLVRAEPRATLADMRIVPPDELLEFLRMWAPA